MTDSENPDAAANDPVAEEGGEVDGAAMEGVTGARREGRYSVLGEIARGGMGAIVEIVDNDIHRPVAMKVILEGSKREQLERFVEEAQVTGQLEHPNIVPVHEMGLTVGEGESGARPYFTMKLGLGFRQFEGIRNDPYWRRVKDNPDFVAFLKDRVEKWKGK